MQEQDLKENITLVDKNNMYYEIKEIETLSDGQKIYWLEELNTVGESPFMWDDLKNDFQLLSAPRSRGFNIPTGHKVVKPSDDFGYFDYHKEEMAKRRQKKCECGAIHTSFKNHHFDWCPLYRG